MSTEDCPQARSRSRSDGTPAAQAKGRWKKSHRLAHVPATRRSGNPGPPEVIIDDNRQAPAAAAPQMADNRLWSKMMNMESI